MEAGSEWREGEKNMWEGRRLKGSVCEGRGTEGEMEGEGEVGLLKGGHRWHGIAVCPGTAP